MICLFVTPHILAEIHCAYSQRDGQAELACVLCSGCLYTEMMAKDGLLSLTYNHLPVITYFNIHSTGLNT